MSHRPFMPAPYAMAAGATPNEMTSASESSSRPIAECTRRERATRPSSTSSARATGMSAAAASSRCGLRVSRYPMTANTASTPHPAFPSVRKSAR